MRVRVGVREGGRGWGWGLKLGLDIIHVGGVVSPGLARRQRRSPHVAG